MDELSGVNRVVETKEVRLQLELWKEAIENEVRSLEEKQAIEIYRGNQGRST